MACAQAFKLSVASCTATPADARLRSATRSATRLLVLTCPSHVTQHRQLPHLARSGTASECVGRRQDASGPSTPRVPAAHTKAVVWAAVQGCRFAGVGQLPAPHKTCMQRTPTRALGVETSPWGVINMILGAHVISHPATPGLSRHLLSPPPPPSLHPPCSPLCLSALPCSGS